MAHETPTAIPPRNVIKPPLEELADKMIQEIECDLVLLHELQFPKIHDQLEDIHRRLPAFETELHSPDLF